MVIKTFHVDVESGSTGARAYLNLIVDLRRSAAAGDRVVHGLGVLPAETANPADFIDVGLKTTTNLITVRLRRDNLYLIGYLPSYRTRWYEFSDTHLIQGSEALPHDGHYTTLEKKANASRRDIALGFGPTEGAVNALAQKGAPSSVEIHARSLIILIEAISEAMRSTVACEFIRSKWELGTAEKPTLRIVTLENSWDPISKAIMENHAVTDRSIAIAHDQATTPMDIMKITVRRANSYSTKQMYLL
ncbi:hypothetical protein TWF970_005558 [Orbilia oligospora]|uniref:Uncharacterized protein n=1 Tax=Orbilia oligospora TaxID=2813651 RepID=A0A7C8VFB4_ORBOL|nr:hypothetical protein TWF970_005558 [Orbilia oligospora]